MGRSIEDILVDYKNCTYEIIEVLKEEDTDSLSSKIDKRQSILDELICETSKKNEAKELYKKLNVGEVDGEAKKLMEKKALLMKEKLKSISRNRAANSAYGRGINSPKIFSKKI